MKRSTLILALIILVAGLAALGFGAAHRQHGARGHHAFGQHQGPGGPGGPRGGDHRFRELNLTDAQKAQVKAIHEKQREEAEALHEQMRGIHEQMRPLVEAAAFDEAAVRALLAKEAAIATELKLIEARGQNAVFNVLTAEQKATLAERRPRHEGRR
ncbi:MAG: Spy/CpxP family protein refolding chaperone [Blastocatellia bacterium]|nr:Spy/CpxP family protein refolding chaperone [Blastocatellia bacterium]